VATQPLRTINGFISRAGSPAQVYVDAVNFSILVQDRQGTTVFSVPEGTGISPNASGVVYDPVGTGAVATTVQAKLRESVSVLDFGAVGDGVTDDTAAIQSAVTALPSGATLLFPPGTYKLTASVLLAGKTNITLLGYGTTIQCGASRIESYFNIDSSSAINVFGFIFDAKMQSMPTYTPADYDDVYNCGIYTYSGAQNVSVKDCAFINLYTVGAFFRASSNVIVTDCRFSSPLQTQTQNLQHLMFQTSASIKVTSSHFDNAVSTNPAVNACGIFASGITRFITIDACSFNYCGRDNTGTHRLGVIDFYYDVDGVSVTNCVSTNTMAEFMRLSTCNTAIISSNRVEYSANSEISGLCISLQSGAVYLPSSNTKCRNITISNNVFVNDVTDVAVCIGVYSYDWGAWSENIVIDSNAAINFRRLVSVKGPFNGVKISDNQSISTSSNVCGIIELAHMAGINSSYGAQANSYFNDLDIVNNTIGSLGNNGFISIDMTAISTTAYVGAFNISSNVIDSTPALSGNIGISVNLRSATPSNTTLTLDNNFIQRYNYAFQIVECGNVVLTNNKSKKNTNYLIQSGNLTFNAHGNITRNGSLFGRSKLAGGSVTVLGSDCNTNDNIMVSHFDNSGVTLGTLYLANIGNGIFDIKSTSATDDANVVWHVIH
jgi:polygalacturonase